jgi:hypothetical protein
LTEEDKNLSGESNEAIELDTPIKTAGFACFFGVIAGFVSFIIGMWLIVLLPGIEVGIGTFLSIFGLILIGLNMRKFTAHVRRDTPPK